MYSQKLATADCSDRHQHTNQLVHRLVLFMECAVRANYQQPRTDRQTQIHTNTHTHAHTHTCTRAHTHAHTHTLKHTRTCARTHMRARAHTHTHTHTHTLGRTHAHPHHHHHLPLPPPPEAFHYVKLYSRYFIVMSACDFASLFPRASSVLGNPHPPSLPLPLPLQLRAGL